MRVLIIGGAGFVGTATGARLRGHEVFILHRGTTCSPLANPRHIHVDKGDLVHHTGTLRQLRPDVVIDMSPQNAADAASVIECFRGHTQHFVVISSGSVYRSFGILLGNEAGEVELTPATEESPLRTKLFPYRQTVRRAVGDPLQWLDNYDKIPAEGAYLEHPDLNVTVLRLPMVFGPNDVDRRVQAYLGLMKINPEYLVLRPDIAAWRNSRSYVGDVAHAIVLATEAMAGGVYNLSDGFDFTEQEWIERVGRAAGWQGTVRTEGLVSDRTLPIYELPIGANFAQHQRLNDQKFREVFGPPEEMQLEDAILKTVEGRDICLPQ